MGLRCSPAAQLDSHANCSVALYGLLLFYGLVHEELAGRRPLAKFLAIKAIIMFVFYQSFVVRTVPPYHCLKG